MREQPLLREQVGKALLQKAGMLNKLYHRAVSSTPQEAAAIEYGKEAIDACDELIRRFDPASDPWLHKQVGEALRQKAEMLDELYHEAVKAGDPGRAIDYSNAAIDAYDELIRRFDDETPDLQLRGKVAFARLNLARHLVDLGNHEVAIAVYDKLIQQFDQAPDLSLHVHVATAHLAKGNLLVADGHHEEAIPVLGQLIGTVRRSHRSGAARAGRRGRVSPKGSRWSRSATTRKRSPSTTK